MAMSLYVLAFFARFSLIEIKTCGIIASNVSNQISKGISNPNLNLAHVMSEQKVMTLPHMIGLIPLS